MWWRGPQFILQPPSRWPNAHLDFASSPPPSKEAESELKIVSSTIIQDYKSFIPFQRTNSYAKLVRVTAYALKFLSKLYHFRSKKQVDHQPNEIRTINHFSSTSWISTSDWKATELLIIREHYREGVAQLESRAVQRFQVELHDDGTYRSMSRMAHATSTATVQNPILLLPHHPLTRMVVTYFHLKLLHAGASHVISALRRTYLIPRIRRIANSVISACVTCRKHQGRFYAYPKTPDLPPERVNPSRPFANSGLDYFGPIVVRAGNDQERKVWVSLFTCMSTRAIHLEVVADNSTTQFLLAFRRFISRRGCPDLVLSDNAPTFKLGRHVLVNELRQLPEDKAVKDFGAARGLQWRFITPLSPWKGGFYERLVGSVKTALKKTVHKNILDLWNLQTLLTEIEATINTRPLTPLTGSAADGALVLRPIDLINPQFTLGHLENPTAKVTSSDHFANSDSQEFLVSQYSILRDSLQTFWELWQKDYLQVLAERNQLRSSKTRSSGTQPKIGDVVLLFTDNSARSNWPLGVVIQVNRSADGAVRSVKVRTGRYKILDRSTNQLIPLEIAAEDSKSICPKELKKPTRIQPPRKVKKTTIH